MTITPLKDSKNEHDTTDQASRLANTTPLVFVHVPKTGGTTFLLNLMLDKRICHFAEPREAGHFIKRWDKICGKMHRNGGNQSLATFKIKSSHAIRKHCPGVAADHIMPALHEGVGSIFEETKGRLMTIMRDPSQRLLSGYHFHTHGWPSSREVPKSAEQYAKGMSGCNVRMLTRDGFSCSEQTKPAAEEVKLAQQRLREGFSFIGLTEEWDLTVCLFHAKFGGQCTVHEFANRRPTIWRPGQKDANGTKWAIAELNGYQDPWDEALYATAKGLFQADLSRYGVSRATCTSCFEAKSDAATEIIDR
jgi:hypothetical protein